MTNSSARLAQQYEELGGSVRVVIIHPNLAQQHLLLPALLDTATYVRFEGDGLAQDALAAQFDAALGGEKLKATSTVVLDECDRAKPDALAAFVVDTLLPQVKRGRIVISSRQVPLELAQHEQLQGHICFLPSDDANMLADYAQPFTEGKHLLEVWALGAGRVMIDGRAVESWDGVLPRSLFFYIVDRGMTTRAEIFETFWPMLTVREATNVFHVTKRKVSEVLGTDLTVFQSGFYHIADDIELHYDVSLFNQYVQDSAVAEPAEAQALLQHAISLYRGAYVTTLATDWAANRRGEIALAYADALVALARLVDADGNREEALNWYLRAFHQHPQREDTVEHILRLTKKLKRTQDGLDIYRQYETALHAQNGGIPPAPELRKLAESMA